MAALMGKEEVAEPEMIMIDVLRPPLCTW